MLAKDAIAPTQGIVCNLLLAAYVITGNNCTALKLAWLAACLVVALENKFVWLLFLVILLF